MALEVKRRLEKSNPGANLSVDAVKLVAIPGVPFDATVFCFEQASNIVMVVELARPGLPHIYNSAAVRPGRPKDSAAVMLKGLVGLAHTIRTDPRFKRNIITLNGHGRGGLILPGGLKA
jgi:hypothetical protein